MIADDTNFKNKILEGTIKEHRKEIVFQRALATLGFIFTIAMTAYGLHYNRVDIQERLTQDIPIKNWVVYLFSNYWSYLIADISFILITIRCIIRIKHELIAIDTLTNNVWEETTSNIILKNYSPTSPKQS